MYRIPRHDIDVFESTGVAMDFLPAMTGGTRTNVHVAHLEPGGTLGRHPATRLQVFAVVHGEGEAQGDDGPGTPISTGMLVVWEPGEWHQSWASTPMTVVIVETDAELDLSHHVAL